VVHSLLKEIIPRYRIPISIGSDNGPVFVAEVVKQLTQGLKITWTLHTVHQPQSSGQVERMNQTLKTQMRKLCQGTHLTWEQVLPLVFLGSGVAPPNRLGSHPMRFSTEGHPPLIKEINRYLKEIENSNFTPTDVPFGRSPHDLYHHIQQKLPISLTTNVHSFKPGDQV
jgi:transposase InsO family protein